MSKPTILFADNDLDFLKTRADFLEQEGYRIIPVDNPTKARRLLEGGEVDLAILDIRLRDDDDDKDTSGLTIAKEVMIDIPKIILTNFPSVNAVREALRPQLSGLPPSVNFLAKQEGPEELLRAIRQTFESKARSNPGNFARNELKAELRGIESALEELEIERDKGRIDIGRYLLLKEGYETRKAKLEESDNPARSQ